MGCVLSSSYSPFYYIIPKSRNPALKGKKYATGADGDGSNNPDETPNKVYSWDAKKEVDKSNFMIENRRDEVIFKLPGSLNGTQFIIQNLENCTVYLLDHIAQLSVDDCKNCRFVVGPSKGSVFIRDTSDCSFVIVCQQFRTRDCKRITSFLSCCTQPIIESSAQMKFGCVSINYSKLSEHLLATGLSPFNNNWNNIHDFTPVPGEPNYSFLGRDHLIEDYVPVIQDESVQQQVQLTFAKNHSVIPYTTGISYRPANQSVLVIIFATGSTKPDLDKQEIDASRILVECRNRFPELVLVQTKKYNLSELSAESVFGSKVHNAQLTKGPIIGMELNGTEAIQKCDQVVKSLGLAPNAYVSPNTPNLSRQIDNFYNFAEMVMSI